MPERFRIEGPDLEGLLRRKQWFFGGHAGDEYGNCTLYFRCPLFGVIWWYPTGHYQTEIELPWPDATLEQYKAWVSKFVGVEDV